MKNLLFTLALLGLAIFVAPHGSLTAQDSQIAPADQKALALLVQQIDSAYNVQDATRFSELFTDDANFEFPNDSLAMHGRKEIRDHFAEQFKAYPLLRHVTTTGETNILAPGLMAVDMKVDIYAPDPKTGTGQALLVQYTGIGIGSRSETGWHIRYVRLYRQAK